MQIAARAPEELGAVISVASTDDRYSDDVHYMGGCVFGSDMLSWASTMLAYNARPPDPEVVGDSWRGQWLDRIERTPPFVENWLAHQRRDRFWKQGSVCEDYSALKCAVYMVGGWADATGMRSCDSLSTTRGRARASSGPGHTSIPMKGRQGRRLAFSRRLCGGGTTG